MSTSRPVRIPRTRSPGPGSTPAQGPGTDSKPPLPLHLERRVNVGGSQRAVRVAGLFVVTLGALYAAFALYDRSAPGGTASPAGNGLLFFTVVFLLFAIVGVVYSVTPAPRAVEVGADRVTVVGRWGRRSRLPALELLSVSVVRRYPAGWLSSREVELIELFGEDTPRRSYLADAGLFAGARTLPRRP